MSELIDFLKARIAEDEAGASSFHETYCGWSLHEGPGFSEDGCQCGHPRRILAECAAKRAIIEAFDPVAPDLDPHVGVSVLSMLAAVHADHPDYRQEWSVVQG